MPLTINTRAFSFDGIGNNQVTYRDPSATASSPSTCRLTRIDPIPQGSFPGVTKTDARLSRRCIVGEANWPAVVFAGSSIPANATPEFRALLLADFRSLVASAEFADMWNSGTIMHA